MEVKFHVRYFQWDEPMTSFTGFKVLIFPFELIEPSSHSTSRLTSKPGIQRTGFAMVCFLSNIRSYDFWLRPSAKDLGITWVVLVVLVVVVVVVVHHLVHLLFKRNVCEKKSLWLGIASGSFRSTAKHLKLHWATEPLIVLLWKLISISRRRPWASIGRHLFG